MSRVQEYAPTPRPYGYGTSAYYPLGPALAPLAEAQLWPPSPRLQVSTVEKRQPVYHAQCTPEYGAL
eukprot:CAMPEP_0177747880 /NCGR_PEP_ID=MMETSP0484_2-20121128/31635_1 /TAXON_ID=354590 /ORGANISM="Rhodomonas lens, Strain RHODO" /LENGTH=66 /DNA_ID=CAMNT_0019262719 /DNA_START=55 /DNA_END=256 /DNA_ORIENTATION=-